MKKKKEKKKEKMNVEKRVVAKAERAFLHEAILGHGLRMDGRRDVDSRPLRISFADNGVCEVQLGRTRVLCVVSSKVVEPFADRGHDGTFEFQVNLSPMASSEFPKEATMSPGETFARSSWFGLFFFFFSFFCAAAIQICRTIERTFRDSGAIDTESLCILAGSKVWAVAVEMTVLDHSGNLTDACSYAAMAALMHFRRPSVTVSNSGSVTLHSWSDLEPSPLALHHTPVCVSFGFVQNEGKEAVIVDPSDQEELVCEGTASIALNLHGEICSLHFVGAAVEPHTLQRCVNLAAIRAREIIAEIEAAVEKSLQEGGNIGRRNLIAYLEAK